MIGLMQEAGMSQIIKKTIPLPVNMINIPKI